MTTSSSPEEKILDYSENYYVCFDEAIQAEKSNDFDSAVQCYIRGLEFSNRCLQEQVHGNSPFQNKARDMQNELRLNRQMAIERLAILYSYLETNRVSVNNKNKKIDSCCDSGSSIKSEDNIKPLEDPAFKNSTNSIHVVKSDKNDETEEKFEDNIESETTIQSVIPELSIEPQQIHKDVHTETDCPKPAILAIPISPRPRPSGFTPIISPVTKPFEIETRTNDHKYNEFFRISSHSNVEPISGTPVIKTISNSPRPQPSRISLESETKPKENEKIIIDKESIWKALKNVDELSVEIILNEILDNKVIKLEDIVGNETAKKFLLESVIYPKLRPERFTGLKSSTNGILLFGPPGNGKGLLATAVANESQCVFFNVSAASLMSKWIKAGEKMIEALFAVADYFSPSVIFLDEVDLLLYTRIADDKSVSRKMFSVFLQELDRVSTNDKNNVLIMAATEQPFELDDDALKRFQKKIYIKMPEAVSRKAMLKKLFVQQTTKLNEAEIDKLVELTSGYSLGDLTNVVKTAVMVPIKEISYNNIFLMTVDEVRPTEYSDFVWALRKIKPIVSSLMLLRYDNWDGKFGDLLLE